LIKSIIKPNNYMDSVFLMKAGKEVMKVEGVKKAVAVMGTDLNKTVLIAFSAATIGFTSVFFVRQPVMNIVCLVVSIIDKTSVNVFHGYYITTAIVDAMCEKTNLDVKIRHTAQILYEFCRIM